MRDQYLDHVHKNLHEKLHEKTHEKLHEKVREELQELFPEELQEKWHEGTCEEGRAQHKENCTDMRHNYAQQRVEMEDALMQSCW